jgi:hypothetical protein
LVRARSTKARMTGPSFSLTGTHHIKLFREWSTKYLDWVLHKLASSPQFQGGNTVDHLPQGVQGVGIQDFD